MNEKTKNFLRIFGVWYVIAFVITIIADKQFLYMPWIGFSLLIPVLVPLLLFLVFLPTIILLYFLFKIIKNKVLRMLLIAFAIPFTNLIYFLIGIILSFGKEFSLEIGSYSLFFILPTVFATALCLPKKWLSVKWEIVITSVLMWLFGIALIFLFLKSIFIMDEVDAKQSLKSYQPLIQSIEDYKTKYGKYPSKVTDNVKTFKYMHYITKNNGKDYILTVSDYEYTEKYNYCSNKTFEGCHPDSDNAEPSPDHYIQFGDWIKVYIDD